MISNTSLRIGEIELSGVLSSCATEEKNEALIFWPYFSTVFILVMSVHITIICVSLFILLAFTYRYILGFFERNTFSTCYFLLLIWVLMYSHIFVLLLLCPSFSSEYSQNFATDD